MNLVWCILGTTIPLLEKKGPLQGPCLPWRYLAVKLCFAFANVGIHILHGPWAPCPHQRED